MQGHYCQSFWEVCGEPDVCVKTRICCTKSCWALFSFNQTLCFLTYSTSDICRSGFKLFLPSLQNSSCHSVPFCLGFRWATGMISVVSLPLYGINLYHHPSRYILASSTLAGTVCIPGHNLWLFTDACFISLASNSPFEHVLCMVYVKK